MIFITNLKSVPAFERYEGGGDARAFDVCLSRSNIIILCMCML